MQYIARQIHAEESFGTVGTCRKAATVKMTKKTWDCQSFMEVIEILFLAWHYAGTTCVYSM